MIGTIVAASALAERQQNGTGRAFHFPRADIVRYGAARDGGVRAN
jgi:hypothetical protein